MDRLFAVSVTVMSLVVVTLRFKKVKSGTHYTSMGRRRVDPKADPRQQAVSHQFQLVVYLLVSCCYFPPGLWLSFQLPFSQYQIILLDDRGIRLQLTIYLSLLCCGARPGLELVSYESQGRLMLPVLLTCVDCNV